MECPQRVVHRIVLAVIGVCALAAPALAQDCAELLGQRPGDEVRLVTGAGADASAGNLTMFTVADVWEPPAPDVVGQLGLGGGMLDMTAANGYVFVAIGEMWVIDVSEPTSPQIVGTSTPTRLAASQCPASTPTLGNPPKFTGCASST